MAAFSINADRVRTRILATMKRLSPDSQEARAALFRIGNLLRNYAMDELTASGAVDEGHLRGRLGFVVESSDVVSTVTLHTGGVKYARIVDQGGPFTPAMRRAMFAAMRARGKGPKPSKGIVKGGHYRGRAYMGPAARRARPEILEEIRRLAAGAPS